MIDLLSRHLRPYLLLGVGVARTVVYAVQNARRDPEKSLRFAHMTVNDPSDLARFMVRLALRYMSADLASRESFDIVLLTERDAPLNDYMFLPYLWTSAFNVHVVHDESELEALLPTLGTPSAVAQLRSDLAQSGVALTVDSAVIGRMGLPALFVNRAREFMKAQDWRAYYCAISLDAEASPAQWLEAFHELATTHPAWRFQLLGLNGLIGDYTIAMPPNVVAPGRSSMTFLGQLAVAMQADAFVGPLDIFGIASVMSGVHATLLNGGAAVSGINFVEADVNLRHAPTGASITLELQQLLTEREASIRLAIEQAGIRSESTG